MNDIKTQLRQLAINMLDDDDGISEAAYVSLRLLESTIADKSCDDIFEATDASEGRFFLPEDHGIKA